MNARELRLSDADLLRERDRQLGARSEKRRRTAPKRAAREKRERIEDERDAAFYEQAKRDAAARATDSHGVRCEVYDGPYFRCPMDGVDPDHVLGGSSKQECERLGAEGLQIMCRGHHDLKTANSPSRGFWLLQAADHAKRHGYRRLAALVAKARARYEAQHPSPSPASPQETP